MESVTDMPWAAPLLSALTGAALGNIAAMRHREATRRIQELDLVMAERMRAVGNVDSAARAALSSSLDGLRRGCGHRLQVPNPDARRPRPGALRDPCRIYRRHRRPDLVGLRILRSPRRDLHDSHGRHRWPDLDGHTGRVQGLGLPDRTGAGGKTLGSVWRLACGELPDRASLARARAPSASDLAPKMWTHQAPWRGRRSALCSRNTLNPVSTETGQGHSAS